MKENRFPFITAFSTFTLTVLGATIFEIGGIFAGRTAVLLQQIHSKLPWIFLIYPLMLTVRGDINGILTGKLGSNLHLGNIQPQWKGNSHIFYKLISLTFTLSIIDSIFVGFVSFIFGLLFGIEVNLFQMLIISVTTFTLASLTLMSLTVSLAFIFFRKKIDPDVYVLPITAPINDILITLIFFLVCIFYRPWKTKLHFFVGIPFLILGLSVASFFLIFFRKSDFFRNGFFQAVPTLLVTASFAGGTGTILSTFSSFISRKPILLVVYPAVNSLIGDQSAILANTTTTKLHLGSIKPDMTFIKSQEFLVPISSLMVSGLIINCFYSIIGTAIAPLGNWTSSYYLSVLFVLLITSGIAFTCTSIIATISALLTYKLGLDPDNLVTPILTSSADLISTIILVNMAKLILT